jgi:hypothetical protein
LCFLFVRRMSGFQKLDDEAEMRKAKEEEKEKAEG